MWKLTERHTLTDQIIILIMLPKVVVWYILKLFEKKSYLIHFNSFVITIVSNHENDVSIYEPLFMIL